MCSSPPPAFLRALPKPVPESRPGPQPPSPRPVHELCVLLLQLALQVPIGQAVILQFCHFFFQEAHLQEGGRGGGGGNLGVHRTEKLETVGQKPCLVSVRVHKRMCPHYRGHLPPTPGQGQGLCLPSPQIAAGGLPTTPGEHAHIKPVLHPLRTYLLRDVVVTGVNAVSEQVLSATVTATEVAAVHELPVGEGGGRRGEVAAEASPPGPGVHTGLWAESTQYLGEKARDPSKEAVLTQSGEKSCLTSELKRSPSSEASGGAATPLQSPWQSITALACCLSTLFMPVFEPVTTQ